MDAKLEQALTRYKQARDGLLHSDEDSFVHHVREFVRELRRNALTKPIIEGLPAFDVDGWLSPIVERWKRTRDAAFDFPEDENERLVVHLDFLESMAAPPEKQQMTVEGFGNLLNLHKRDKATAAAIDLVARPFCDRINERLQRAAAIANPAGRELAGVPLNRIPASDATGILCSHKTIDKPVVRPFYDALRELGFSPWLDAKEMRPGEVLHRGITEGFDRACAVVFFITKNFVDERWLKMEIDEAVHRKIERGDRFSIITLLFDGAVVPRPLERYIWIKVDDPVDALRELIRGLPIVVGPPRWRE